MSVRVVEVAQGTPEWLDLRDGLIGSSTVPAIMGMSPWLTCYGAWRLFTGKDPKRAATPQMLEGTKREAEIRMEYELELVDAGITVPATVLVDEDRGFIASLDGRNAEHHRQLEVKWMGEADYKYVLDGKVPPKYVPQLSWQLYLGREVGDVGTDFVAKRANSNDKPVIVPFNIDAALELYWEVELLPAVLQFQEWVRTDTEPPLSSKDVVLVEDLELELLAMEIRDLTMKALPLTSALKVLKEDLKERCLKIHPRTKVADILVTRFTSGGGPDWEAGYGVAVARVKELADIIGEPVNLPELPVKKGRTQTRVTVQGMGDDE